MAGNDNKKKVLILLDVDGTIANLTETIFHYLAKKKVIGPEELRLLTNYRKRKGRRLMQKELGIYQKIYREAMKLLSEKENLNELRTIIKNSIYPDVLPVLTRAPREVEFVLFSNAPHHAVKLLAEILRKEGAPIKAALGSHPVLGIGKALFIETSLLPEEWLKERPVLWIDNRDSREDIEKVRNTYPHIHPVYVKDYWSKEDGKPLSEINWEKEIQEARRKWREVRKR